MWLCKRSGWRKTFFMWVCGLKETYLTQILRRRVSWTRPHCSWRVMSGMCVVHNNDFNPIIWPPHLPHTGLCLRSLLWDLWCDLFLWMFRITHKCFKDNNNTFASSSSSNINSLYLFLLNIFQMLGRETLPTDTVLAYDLDRAFFVECFCEFETFRVKL